MKQQHKNEPYTNVPELRQQLVEKWYDDEWGTQDETPSPAQPLQPIAHLTSLIRRLSHPTNRAEPTAAPHSELEDHLTHRPEIG